MENMKFKNLLAFMVLMSGEKILQKAPPYLIEKFEQYTGLSIDLIDGSEDQSGWLDSTNRLIYGEYLRYYKIN